MPQSNQSKLLLWTTIIVILTFLSIILFKTEMILDNTTTNNQIEKTKITIITSDVIEDQSWGSLAYKGKMKIEEQFPISAELFSEIKTEEQMKNTITKAVAEDSKVIIGHGREFSNYFTKISTSYPDIHFVTIHGTAQHPNQTVYTFDQNKIEYTAALAAGMKTKSNKIGLIDAYEARKRLPGFEQGLKQYKPEAVLYYSVVNSRDDGEKAVELMKEMIDQGVDVIFTKGNGYNRDVIDYAKKKNIFVIGYLDDQSYMGEEHVLTSVVNDVPQAYIAVMKDFYSEGGISQGKVVLNEKDGVYNLAPLGPMYTEEEKQYIRSEIDKLNGEDGAG
ncbi:BMP family ABC transporter substrate-binding protein [Domibacillus mangrovi]|uniref:BMP family ABC transporter substrate-binding protein n=1 Tax=Domibacillus mangrovi TaxID=1714354 RepID=A0A1Q5P506_9BACI|nr:BMP family ABC transporter substrate-binding protein [Domibacillus mangrovi]OKL37359.1 BMP family ABC transporter substrate-binding protein [Domibacillus mangrovi]